MTLPELQTKFLLAPMEGVNCASFRILCRKRGAALVFTDVIDADEFAEFAKNNSSEEAIKKFVNPQKEERPLAVQLAGANVENLLFCSKLVENCADVIDYNAGCPLPKILAKKAGAFLMKHPEQLYKIVSAFRKELKMPLTVKLRSGWDSESVNVLEVAKKLEELGVDAVIIHPRTRKQGYSDKADWNLVKKIKESIKIPVVLSGDVCNAYTAKKAFEITKCDFIMIGRAAQANPSVFKQMNDAFDSSGKLKEEIKPPLRTYCKSEVNPVKDFIEFLEYYDKIEIRHNISEIRDHAIWTAIESRNGTEIKKKIIAAKTEEEIVDAVKELKF